MVSIRASRGPLLPKPVSWFGLAVSYSKSALALEPTDPVSESLTQMPVELINIHLISVQTNVDLRKILVTPKIFLSILLTFFDIIQIVCMEVAIQFTTAIESPFHGRMSIMKALLDHKASSGLLLRCDDSETTPSPLSLHG